MNNFNVSYDLYINVKLVTEKLNSIGAIGLQKASSKITQELLFSKHLNGDQVRKAKEDSQLKAAEVLLKGSSSIENRKKEISSRLKSLENNLLKQAKEFLTLTYELEELFKV